MKFLKSKLMAAKISWLYVLPASVVLGLLFSFVSNKLMKVKQQPSEKIASQKIAPINSQPYINPMLSCVGQFHELKPFKSRIQTLIDDAKLKGKATQVSVFFRSLNNGYLFGINRKEKYYPASLLKVPVMMAYLKQALKDPQLLEKKVKFEKAYQGVPPNEVIGKIEVGREYSIKDLIEKMVVLSDNDATLLLNDHINPEAYKTTLKELGLNIPERTTPDDNFMVVEDYGRILRILYNSSYLNRDLSNYALMLLSKAQYSEGIPSGTQGKQVSHKFGEWFYNGEFQLHDCGIVYHAEQPYLLCIMAKGKDIKMLASVIASISKVVAESVENNYVPISE